MCVVIELQPLTHQQDCSPCSAHSRFLTLRVSKHVVPFPFVPDFQPVGSLQEARDTYISTGLLCRSTGPARFVECFIMGTGLAGLLMRPCLSMRTDVFEARQEANIQKRVGSITNFPNVSSPLLTLRVPSRILLPLLHCLAKVGSSFSILPLQDTHGARST